MHFVEYLPDKNRRHLISLIATTIHFPGKKKNDSNPLKHTHTHKTQGVYFHSLNRFT